MTSPLDSYTASMGDLHFSDEAKARMAEILRAAAAARDAEKNARPAASAEVLTMPALRPARPHARRWARVAAGLALALVLGGGATAAVAAGVLPNPADVLSDVFGGAPAQTELLNNDGSADRCERDLERRHRDGRGRGRRPVQLCRGLLD